MRVGNRKEKSLFKLLAHILQNKFHPKLNRVVKRETISILVDVGVKVWRLLPGHVMAKYSEQKHIVAVWTNYHPASIS